MKIVKMLDEDQFFIQFTYDPAVVTRVRCLPMGRKWVPELKAWICPASVDALRQLREWQFDIQPDVMEWEREWLNPSKPIIPKINDVPGLKKPLYPFQAEGVGFLESRGGRALIGDEMGLGKTIQALAWLQYNGNPVLPAVVVCPASLKGNWERECREWTTLTPCVLSGRDHSHTPLGGWDVCIINYDILPNWKDWMDRIAIKTVVLDECFTYDTLVSTDKGKFPIGEIVERKMPVNCLSYNFLKKKLCFKPIIRYIKNQKAKTIIKIKWNNGTITCSPNHKIWEMTANEYKTADQIKTGDILRMVQEKSCEKMETILLPLMRHFLEYVNSGISRKNTLNRHEKTAIPTYSLRVVQKMDSTTAWKKTKTILQYILFRSLENESTRNKETDILVTKSYLGKEIGTNEKCTLEKLAMGRRQFQKNERKQSLTRSRGAKENEGYKDTQGNMASMERRSWWKRLFNSTSNYVVGSDQGTDGILRQHKTSNEFDQESTKELQNRHSITRKKTGNRSRWWQPSKSDQSKIRSEKRFGLTNVRVESIEILESRDNERSTTRNKQDQFLYNLEIKDTHNYFANGVLVSNCHFIKNQKAQRTKATKAFCHGKQHIIALSGTPIINRPVEFFTTLNILAPDSFSKWWNYVYRYCNAKYNGFGWDFTGASHTDELHKKLNGNIMLRRLKEDVLTDLPPKTQTIVPLTLNGNRGFYTAALREAKIAWQDEKADPLADITQISKLRQAAMDAKYELCREWLDNFLETNRKLVVFTVHHKTIDRLMERYGKIAVNLDGRTDQRLRSGIVEKFQTDPAVRMIIGNIQVLGLGFSLTAAQDAVILEFPWTPGELDQAEDRIHRIGQKGAANIYYLVAQETLEEDILQLINEKRKVITEVLDGNQIIDAGISIQKELVSRLKKE